MAEQERWLGTASLMREHGLGHLLEGLSPEAAGSICAEFEENREGLDLGVYRSTALRLLRGGSAHELTTLVQPKGQRADHGREHGPGDGHAHQPHTHTHNPPDQSMGLVSPSTCTNPKDETSINSLFRTAYCILGGGIGERLGHAGIKLGIEVDSLIGDTYLGLYLRKIKAYYLLAHSPLYHNSHVPCVVIMTSRETHAQTHTLLTQNDYFGFPPNKIACLQQTMVPAVADLQATLATHKAPDGTHRPIWKPHGHGDIHSLLYRSGVARQWAQVGVKNIVMLQDTNAPMIHSIPRILSTLEGQAYDSAQMVFIAVPRRPGEAVGTLCGVPAETAPHAHTHTRTAQDQNGPDPTVDDATGVDTTHAHGKTVYTVNVEYNLFGPLLEKLGKADEADESGWSVYPGNTNALIFGAHAYYAILVASRGSMPEFMNPKYADAAKTVLSSPARIETMMQDIACLYWDPSLAKRIEDIVSDPSPPKDSGDQPSDESALAAITLPPRPWGTTYLQLPRIECFSPMKNGVEGAKKCARAGLDPACPLSAEADYYRGIWNGIRGAVGEAGGQVTVGEQPVKVDEIEVSMPPPVSFDPGSPLVLRSSWRTLFSPTCQFTVSARSALVVKGHVEIHSLNLDGAALFIAPPGAKITIKNATIKNDSFSFQALSNDSKRGVRAYELVRKQAVVCEAKPGEHIVLTGILQPSPLTAAPGATDGTSPSP